MKAGKKAAALISALILICACLTACEIKIPLIDETKNEETTVETTTLPPDPDGWAAAYSDYLTSLCAGAPNKAGYDYEIEECVFDIADVNADGIPELLISEGDKEASKVDICSYDGYNVIYAGSAGANGEVYYFAETAAVYSYEAMGAQETYTVYSFDGSSLTELWQGVSIASSEELVPVDYLSDNGEEVEYYVSGVSDAVPEDEFREAWLSYVPEKAVAFGRDGYGITRENAVALKNSGALTKADPNAPGSSGGQTVLPEGEDKEIFKNLLLEKAADSVGAGEKFEFADVDGDGSPELFISQGDGANSAVEVYSSNGEKAVLLCTSGSNGKTGYSAENSTVAGSFETEGSENFVVYKIENGSGETVWTGDVITGGDGEKEYFSNGEAVSYEEYLEQYNAYYGEGILTEIGGRFDLTESEISRLF